MTSSVRLAVFGRWGRLLSGTLILALLLRWLAMAWVPLVPQEAYYWMYARHPSLSYFDHPPMVAWVIRAGVSLFGNTQWGVRVAGDVLMLASSFVMYGFARDFFGRRAAFLSAILLQVLPLYFAIGFVATMDSALVFFWLLTLFGMALALQRHRRMGWYLAGLALGGAMLSKYTAALLGLGALLVLIIHRPWRRHLKTVHPYLAAVLALLLFSPVIVWNAQHNWVSFQFQIEGRFSGHLPRRYSFIGFIGQELIIVTPLLFLAIGWIIARIVRRRRLPLRYLVALAFSLPLLTVILVKSIDVPIHINWTAPAYLTILPAITHLALSHLRLGRRRPVFNWAGALRLTTIGCAFVGIAMALDLLVLRPLLPWNPEFGPWVRLANVVETYEDGLEAQSGHEPLVVTEDGCELASEIAFYRTRFPHEVVPATTPPTAGFWAAMGGPTHTGWRNTAGLAETSSTSATSARCSVRPKLTSAPSR